MALRARKRRVAARTSLTGSLSETYRYLPFGERYAGNHTTHQYSGKERDQESGLDYFGARYYTANHGRWMSVDPVLHQISLLQSLNRYSCVLNNPNAGNYHPPRESSLPTRSAVSA